MLWHENVLCWYGVRLFRCQYVKGLRFQGVVLGLGMFLELLGCDNVRESAY